MMTGKQFLDPLAAGMSRLFDRLLEAVFGPGIQSAVYGKVTWLDVGDVLCFVLLFLVMHAIAAAFFRHKWRQASKHPDQKKWRTELIRAIDKPLYLLIWIYGLYLTASPILVRLPSGVDHPAYGFFDALFGVAVFVALFWFFFRLTRVLEAGMAAVASRTETKFDDIIVPLVGRSLRIIVPVIGVFFALPVIGLPPDYAGVVSRGSSILIICVVAYVLFQCVHATEQAFLARYDINVADNLQARKIYTQVHVLSKTLYVVIAIFTVASILMLFEEVRRFGTSILASAGVVGIIVGFAAQRTIANLFAGFQLAITQPIRLDDVVIVEGEWGRVEEIALTYVVIRIWDDRRLVVPLSSFIEKPFQNWTRSSAELLGSVSVWMDYTLPIDEVRKAVKGIVEGNPNWDRRFWNVQVTEANERAMQVRVLATSADSSKGWDLRCDIREQLIAYVQKHHPQSLPRFRAEMAGGADARGSGAHS